MSIPRLPQKSNGASRVSNPFLMLASAISLDKSVICFSSCLSIVKMFFLQSYTKLIPNRGVTTIVDKFKVVWSYVVNIKVFPM